jgi:hypothetical protein
LYTGLHAQCPWEKGKKKKRVEASVAFACESNKVAFGRYIDSFLPRRDGQTRNQEKISIKNQEKDLMRDACVAFVHQSRK